jgi:hypothetical protein
MHGSFRFDYTSGKMNRGIAMDEARNPEILWGRLLSGEPALIRAAWKTLNAAEQKGILRHLQAMAAEEGWQPAQRRAARSALRCLESNREEKGK